MTMSKDLNVKYSIDGKDVDAIKKERDVRQLAVLFEKMQTHQKVCSAITVMTQMAVDKDLDNCCRVPLISNSASRSLGLEPNDVVSDFIAYTIYLHKNKLLDVAE